MGGASTTTPVLAVLEGLEGKEVSLTKLAAELRRAGTPLTDAQIKNTVNRLITRYDYNIDVVMRGQVWRYIGPPSVKPAKKKTSAAELYERVGELTDGTVIVRDEQGKLYKVTEL